MGSIPEVLGPALLPAVLRHVPLHPRMAACALVHSEWCKAALVSLGHLQELKCTGSPLPANVLQQLTALTALQVDSLTAEAFANVTLPQLLVLDVRKSITGAALAAAVCAAPGLVELSLGGCSEPVGCLSSVSQLRELKLGGCSAPLSALQPPPSLTRLQGLSRPTAATFANLQLPNLRCLDVSWPSAEGLEGALAAAPSLTEMRMWGGCEDSASPWPSLAHHTALAVLSFEPGDFREVFEDSEDSEECAVVQLLNTVHTGLQELSLVGAQHGDTGDEAFAAIGKISGLTQLSMTSDARMETIERWHWPALFAGLQQLRKLCLIPTHGDGLTDVVLCCPELRELTISAGDSMVSPFVANLGHLNHLTALDVSDIYTQYDGMLFAVSQLTRLQRLGLDPMLDLDDPEPGEWTRLSSLQQLTWLSLNPVSSRAAFEALTVALRRMPDLRELQLYNSGRRGEFVEAHALLHVLTDLVRLTSLSLCASLTERRLANDNGGLLLTSSEEGSPSIWSQVQARLTVVEQTIGRRPVTRAWAGLCNGQPRAVAS